MTDLFFHFFSHFPYLPFLFSISFPFTTHQPPPHKGTIAPAHCDHDPPYDDDDPPHDADDVQRIAVEGATHLFLFSIFLLVVATSEIVAFCSRSEE